MRTRKKNLIGLVVPDFGLYSVEIMKGINKAIAELPYDLLAYTTGDNEKNSALLHEQYSVSLLSNSITDGVIIVASVASEFIADAPLIAVDPHIVNPNYPSVQGTNYHGALDVMEYLIGLGHHRIGFICGRTEVGTAQRRLKGYRDALTNHGIELEESLIMPGDFTQKTAYKAARQLLALDNPPTAIFAANDQSALGVYQAAEEIGLRIPSDLSVVGFDNISEAKHIGLTTVDQSLFEMGYTAVHMLIKMIDGEALEFDVHKIPTKLLIRTSCQELLQTAQV
jgi:LacI family transcriptional regulator